MPELILHHYPASPFSEKIRLLLGYKQASYQAVTIPVIMPKPDLMPLTGGYRKTPVMQIGANIYCDSAIICRVIDHLYPDNTIYPAESTASHSGLAFWTDTFFFRVSVGVAFQPKALEKHPLFADPTAAAAFMADRAELSKGATDVRMATETAVPYFMNYLGHLNRQLESGDFLFGTSPTIADFSTYHCCWFVYNSEVLRDLFDPFPNLVRWLQTMAEFGQGSGTEITGSQALEMAKNSEPEVQPKIEAIEIENLQLGDKVEIAAIDYGINPVVGELCTATTEELGLIRTDEQVGKVAVLFPRLGFRIAKC